MESSVHVHPVFECKKTQNTVVKAPTHGIASMESCKSHSTSSTDQMVIVNNAVKKKFPNSLQETVLRRADKTARYFKGSL